MRLRVPLIDAGSPSVTELISAFCLTAFCLTRLTFELCLLDSLLTDARVT